jgi:peptide/nickel transport system substrate-binding protein
MRRRTFLAASAATLALPAVGRADNKRALRFIAQSDLAILDPVWTTAYVTRNHGFMVFDTLYDQTGQRDGFKATPQMVAGHTVERRRQDLEAHAARRTDVPHRREGAGTRLRRLDQALGRA